MIKRVSYYRNYKKLTARTGIENTNKRTRRPRVTLLLINSIAMVTMAGVAIGPLRNLYRLVKIERLSIHIRYKLTLSP